MVDVKKVFFIRFLDKSDGKDVLWHGKHKRGPLNVLSFLGAINCNTKPQKFMPTLIGLIMPIIKFLGVEAKFLVLLSFLGVAHLNFPLSNSWQSTIHIQIFSIVIGPSFKG